MILRPDYIKAITPFINAPLVKILSGVRRSGKSTILEMVKNFLLSTGVDARCIISRNYAHAKYEGCTSKEMYADLISEMTDDVRYYLFLDEVQEIENWERVLNTLQEEHNADIYVTGSNSKLLSAEISTYLTGRYVSIPVFTLSFSEYLSFKDIQLKDAKVAFANYLKYGGFPLIALNDFTFDSAYQIADDIYTSVVSKDISNRHNIRNKDLFDRVVKFIVENVGKTFSANSIVAFLKGEQRNLSVETIYNYIKWLSDAFIIYPCQRYDLQGKSVLKTQEKYYLSDVAIKYSQMGFNPKMISAILENIVYLELRRRGYDVYIGKNGTKEIDFVGIKQNEKIYIQVCRQIPENSDRELQNLLEIRDNHPKYIVAMDDMAGGNCEGVKYIHIADFLLNKNWQ